MESKEPPTKKVKTSSEAQEEKDSCIDNTLGGNRNVVIEEIKICLKEIEKLNEKASEEILKIEQKYNKKRKPYFRLRNELFKRLPKFWGTALYQHPHVGAIIQEEEKECLYYINDCLAEEFEDIKLGYQISFYFDENPYLENTVIKKTMHLASSDKARSESTPIKWKKGMDLTKMYGGIIASHAKKKRTHLPPTFFSWFMDNSNAHGDEVAETIKEDVWPSALQYYLAAIDEEENGVSIVEEEEGDDSDEVSGAEGIESEDESAEEDSSVSSEEGTPQGSGKKAVQGEQVELEAADDEGVVDSMVDTEEEGRLTDKDDTLDSSEIASAVEEESNSDSNSRNVTGTEEKTKSDKCSEKKRKRSCDTSHDSIEEVKEKPEG